jgi:hypothetical protein
MFYPQLTDDQHNLIFSSFAASKYPHGLDHVDNEGGSDASAHSQLEEGERWIKVPSSVPNQGQGAGKKRSKAQAAPKKRSIERVLVQDFFTKTP